MNKLNGWKRLWLVTSTVLLLGAGVWAFKAFVTSGVSNEGYLKSQQADFESGRYAAYINKPLALLVEPPYATDGGTCWFIYTTRVVYKIDNVPFDAAAAVSHNRWERLKSFADVFGMAVLAAAFFSALLYGVGWLIAWIRKGFN